jgi:hypothetical protein
MILLDYSQIAIGNFLAIYESQKPSAEETLNLLRHVVLSSILSYKRKFSEKFSGDIVICSDGSNYWRKEFFPFYKCRRHSRREKSKTDWSLLFDSISEIREEIKQNFPYRIIHHINAEADDCIAVLTRYCSENVTRKIGLIEESEPILIISRDSDFFQLHSTVNIKQWSPVDKKYISGNKKDLIEKIVRGEDGDDIPNMFSPDNSFKDHIRQKSVKADRLKEFLEKGYSACQNEQEQQGWNRNKTLIEFSCIPDNINQAIIQQYLDTKIVKDKKKIMDYLIRNRCKLLIDHIEEF